MPQEAAGNNEPLPQHVKDYFDRRHKDPEKLKGHLRKAFAGLSADQVAVLDTVGDALDKDHATPDTYLYAVH